MLQNTRTRLVGLLSKAVVIIIIIIIIIQLINRLLVCFKKQGINLFKNITLDPYHLFCTVVKRFLLS
jgi:hypothetical protein